MNFGKWIFISFVLFAMFIGTLVVVCVRQDVSLVAPDYYKQELVFQNQIDRRNNANLLPVRPTFEIEQSKLTVVFSDFQKVANAELKLFRPSDEKLDQTFNLQPVSGSQQSVDLSSVQRGMYKVSLSWAMDEKEYFVEETLYIN